MPDPASQIFFESALFPELMGLRNLHTDSYHGTRIEIWPSEKCENSMVIFLRLTWLDIWVEAFARRSILTEARFRTIHLASKSAGMSGTTSDKKVTLFVSCGIIQLLEDEIRLHVV